MITVEAPKATLVSRMRVVPSLLLVRLRNKSYRRLVGETPTASSIEGNMESVAFKLAKKIGKMFESLMDPVLLEMGFKVEDSESLRYELKKGWDRYVTINGKGCKIEFKYDELPELTGNVCVELSALNQTESPVWIYGFKEGNKIKTYAMEVSKLAPYAKSWPIRRDVGEFRVPAVLIPKWTFLSQDFVKHFKTINLN